MPYSAIYACLKFNTLSKEKELHVLFNNGYVKRFLSTGQSLTDDNIAVL